MHAAELIRLKCNQRLIANQGLGKGLMLHAENFGNGIKEPERIIANLRPGERRGEEMKYSWIMR
jgi:hypothetical protein